MRKSKIAKVVGLALAAAIGVSFISLSFATDGELQLTVTVRDACGPIEAKITIVNGPDDGAQGVTDGSGQFTFPDLNPGVFYLHIDADNHESLDSDPIVLTSSQNLSFTLNRNDGEPCPGPTPPPPPPAPTFVDLTFRVRDVCPPNNPIGGANITISQNFGNGSTRTTDGGGFAHFGVHNNTNLNWTVSASGFSSASGSVNTGNGQNVNVTLNRTCPGPTPPPPGPGPTPPPPGPGPTPPPPAPTQARLTLVKEVDNTGGGTALPRDFELRVNNQTVRSGDTVSLNAGNYTVSENQRSGYQLVGIRGACDGNGTVTLSAGQNATCVVTNRFIPIVQSATITVIKEVDNTGGGTANPSDFELFVSGQRVTHGNPTTFAPGNYTITETQRANYRLAGIRGACQSNGTVTLTAGQNVICTVRNEFVPITTQMAFITVNKEVDNTGGGSAQPRDFELTVGRQATAGGPITDVQTIRSGDRIGVPPGRLIVSENQRSGYRLVGIRGACQSDGSVTVSDGQSVTCTVSNAFIPPAQQATLTVVKEVDNTGGGAANPSDFELFVNGQRVTHNTTVSFAAGTYTVSENQRAGYRLDGIRGACDSNGRVTLTAGQSATCTVRNVFVPTVQQATLTVIKEVDNTGGGTLNASDFELFVSGTRLTTGVPTTLSAGTYNVTENQRAGYRLEGIRGACANNGNITLTAGQNAVCIVRNVFVAAPANLVLSKSATNNTQNVNATTVRANPGDIITYTLRVQNTGQTAQTSFTISDDITDILQLADVIDFGGGNLQTSGSNFSIVWPSVNIPALATVERSFRVQVKASLPANSDLLMTNVYGNVINVPVRAPAILGAVSPVFQAPPTGAALPISLAGAFAAMALFFGIRNKEQILAKLISR